RRPGALRHDHRFRYRPPRRHPGTVGRTKRVGRLRPPPPRAARRAAASSVTGQTRKIAPIFFPSSEFAERIVSVNSTIAQTPSALAMSGAPPRRWDSVKLTVVLGQQA